MKLPLTQSEFEKKLQARLHPDHYRAYGEGCLIVARRREQARQAKQLKQENQRRKFNAFANKVASTGSATGHRRKMFRSFSALCGGEASRVTSHEL